MNRREFVAGAAAGALGWTLLRPRGAAAEPAVGSDTPRPAVATGWNTWSTRSVLTHVLMPDGLAVPLRLHHFGMLATVDQAVFGEKQLGATAGVHLAAADVKPRRIQVRPGPHAYDGSYTAATVVLGEVTIVIETAHAGTRGLVILVSPSKADYRAPALTVEPCLLWNRPGSLEARGEEIVAHLPLGDLAVRATGAPQAEPNLTESSPAWAFSLEGPIGISVGTVQTLTEIQASVARARTAERARHERYGSLAATQGVAQSCLAWNTIYDPSKDRILTPSSRAWNIARFGYGVYGWDSFFHGWLLAADAPALARGCVREVLRGMAGGGFVPNVVNGSGRRSDDRSQPPVGGLCVLAIHEIAPDRDFLREVFPSLLTWNRWWDRARCNRTGLLSWGSDPMTPKIGDLAEFLQPDSARGAALESGMDNTPMYDEVPFDQTTHLMGLSDVGLNSLYATDCQALAGLAAILELNAESTELMQRARHYGEGLRRLWNPAAGIYQNRLTANGAFSPRLSPTCFYPMLAGVTTGAQTAQMVSDYLLNDAKFGGKWMLPSVPHDDPTFADQVYFRGRIWPPLNFLTYLGLRRAQQTAAASRLAESSLELFERNWRERAGAFENYSGLTGLGGDTAYCDPWLPWSGLLVLAAALDRGLVALPSLLTGRAGGGAS